MREIVLARPCEPICVPHLTQWHAAIMVATVVVMVVMVVARVVVVSDRW